MPAIGRGGAVHALKLFLFIGLTAGGGGGVLLIGGWLGLDFTMDGVWIWALRWMIVGFGVYERFGIYPAPWRGGCSGSLYERFAGQQCRT